MLVLGVDPGPEETAWLLLEGDGIMSFAKESNAVLLDRFNGGPGSFADTIVGAAALWKPDHMAIEMIASYGMAVGKTVFDTCVWIGRFIQAWGGTKYTQVYRKQVALHLCQSPRANDSNVRAALIDKFGTPGTKRNQGKTYGISKDIWSALAIAVTYAEAIHGQP